MANTPPKNDHAASQPAIDRGGGLVEGEPHEAVPREARDEDQRVGDAVATGERIGDQPHAPEVDLQLIAGLAVGHAHGATATAATTDHLRHIALHRARGHRDTTAPQELGDLHRGHTVAHPRIDLVVTVDQQLPCLATSVAAMRTHGLHDDADERVGELRVAAIAPQPRGHRGVDVTADRLAIHAHQPLRCPDALTGQPQPKHLSNLEHSDLPERHAASWAR